MTKYGTEEEFFAAVEAERLEGARLARRLGSHCYRGTELVVLKKRPGCSPEVFKRRISKMLARNQGRWRKRDLEGWLRSMGYTWRTVGVIIDRAFLRPIVGAAEVAGKKEGSFAKVNKRAARNE